MQFLGSSVEFFGVTQKSKRQQELHLHQKIEICPVFFKNIDVEKCKPRQQN